jgi:hypothetical protein
MLFMFATQPNVEGGTTYNSGVNECSPSSLFFKQGQHERDRCRAEENDHELILELLEDELPQRRGGFFGDLCMWAKTSVTSHFTQPC